MIRSSPCGPADDHPRGGSVLHTFRVCRALIRVVLLQTRREEIKYLTATVVVLLSGCNSLYFQPICFCGTFSKVPSSCAGQWMSQQSFQFRSELPEQTINFPSRHEFLDTMVSARRPSLPSRDNLPFVVAAPLFYRAHFLPLPGQSSIF